MLYDTHAHLDFDDFDHDLPQVIERANNAGVTRIITIGTTLESSRKAIAIAENYPSVYAAIGWHPSYVSSAPLEIPDEFVQMTRHEKVVGLGEMGLDYTRPPEGNPDEIEQWKTRQKNLFTAQLKLAAEAHLNVIIHQRDAFNDTVQILKPFTPQLRAVFHCFVGTPTEQAAVAALGSIVSFTGIATFKNAATVRETVQAVPLDGFMLETDCPFLAPPPYRGKRCEPAYVRETAQFIATQKNVPLEQLAAATSQTARNFFRNLS